MITIDQLLESVDLDFEPRFVTKDKSGTVCIWPLEPERMKIWWYVSCEYGVYTCLKLAEFNGKDWTECIYEVPRKATKIERLKEVVPNDPLDIHAKINELVDAVNELKGV